MYIYVKFFILVFVILMHKVMNENEKDISINMHF